MAEVKQNFICIGAQKAGTTTLADILNQHSEIFIPDIKETKFFLFDEDYKKGIQFYNTTYYKNYKGETAAGEFDPDYLLFPYTAQRICDTLGKSIKIIVVLRNPADRAYSHYLMSKKKGVETLNFREAIEAEPSRKSDIKTRKIFAYLERGYYGEQLKQFLDVFPKQNFLFIIFEEDIIYNRKDTIKNIQTFLGVSYEDINVEIHSNEAGQAKNETVRNLVRKPNFAKRFLKIVMPSKTFRKNMRQFFIRKNLKSVSTPRLDEQVKKELITKYFINDIHLTEELIDRKLDIWYA